MTKRFTLALAIFIEAIMLAGCGQTQEIPTETVTEVQQELEEVVIEIPVENEEVINEEVIEEAAKEVPEGPVFTDKYLWELEEWEYAHVNYEQDTDIEIWGNPYTDILYIKDGEREFSVDIFWGSRAANIFKKDFNGDSVSEYLINVLTGTGTGVSMEDLYLVSDVDSTPIATEYDMGAIFEELYQRINCEYQKDYLKTAKIYADGKFLTDVMIKSMVDEYGAYTGLGMGCFISYTYENDIPTLVANAGFCFEKPVEPQYDASVIFSIPLNIEKDGTLLLGDISCSVDYWGGYIDSMSHISDEYKKDCEEMNVCYYDVLQTGDNYKITIWGQGVNDGLTAKYISIYAIDDNGEYTDLLWEKKIENDASYSIVKHNDMHFLMETTTDAYEVIIPKYKAQYVIDSNAIGAGEYKQWVDSQVEVIN